jgi:thymidylate kinase
MEIKGAPPMTTTPITPERIVELAKELRCLREPGFMCLPIDEARALLTLAARAEAYEKALKEIADEKVSQRYVHSVLAVSPDCNRACLWCEAVDSVESFARTALASQGASR